MPLHVRGGADSTDPSSDEEHRYDHVYDNAERGTGRRGSSGRRLLSKQQSESRLPAKGTEPGTDALVPPRPLSPRATHGGTHLPRGRISEKVHEQEGDSVLPLRKSRSVEMLAPQQPQPEASVSVRHEKKANLRKDLARQRRDRDRRRKQARDEKVSRGLPAESLVSTVEVESGAPECVSPTVHQGERTVPSVARFPDAGLKLPFVSIKRKLQKSLAVCQTSSDLYAQQRQQDSTKVDSGRKQQGRFGGSKSSEEFWLDLKAKVFSVDAVDVLQHVRSARARVPLLVQEIMTFFVAPGHDQEQSVERIIAEVSHAQALYQSHEHLEASCREWRRAGEELKRRIELFQLWQHVRSELHLFLASAADTFSPHEDSYYGWYSALARMPAQKRTSFAQHWIERIVKAISDPEHGLITRRKDLSACGLSDLGREVGR